MWNLQLSSNAHILDNVHDIMSSAAAQFTLSQFEHLTALIRDTWQGSNDRIREKLLELIGKLGREATQMKSTQAILLVRYW
jgi:ubiquitin carboxyl-terminal hydrolase 9/24